LTMKYSQVIQKLKLSKNFVRFITYLFKRRTSAFIIILGRRESGKTDFALLIAEILHSTGTIKNIATNIKIYESTFSIEYIDNLEDLEHWASTVRGKKLFIFDEAGKTFRRRTPLSSVNVQILDTIQIMRKYRLSLIFITPHQDYIDSSVWGTDVLDGVFRKTDKNKKIAIYDDYLYGFTRDIFGIPSTSIKFDTWDSAPMKKTKALEEKFKNREFEILRRWANGASYQSLGFDHPQKFNRFIRKNLMALLNNPKVISIIEGREVKL